MNDGSSYIQYLLKDHQGSLAEVAGSDGQVTESYSFDAFGRCRNAQTWTTQNLPASFGIDLGILLSLQELKYAVNTGKLRML